MACRIWREILRRRTEIAQQKVGKGVSLKLDLFNLNLRVFATKKFRLFLKDMFFITRPVKDELNMIHPPANLFYTHGYLTS